MCSDSGETVLNKTGKGCVTIMQLHYREESCIPLWSLSLSGVRKDLKDEWKQAKQRKMGERML